MSSVVIPKERLSAYQRWELASLDDCAAPQIPGNEGKVVSLTAEQIRKIQEEAELAGYAAGFEKGQVAGLSEGRRQSEVLVQQLACLANGFRAELVRADETVAREILDLSLDVAKAMLKVGLEVQPDIVIPVVSEAIHYLPALHQPAILYLHPEDASLVKQYIGEQLEESGWKVVDEPLMERGGCRIETATNQIDATIGTRWQRIASSLGRSSRWLA
jgi:flagellar assembly protein FliH